MTPDELARIEARAADVAAHGAEDRPYTALEVCEDDVPALVAALRGAWVERDASVLLRGMAEAKAERVEAERDEARSALARVTALCDVSEWLNAESAHWYGEWAAGRYAPENIGAGHRLTPEGIRLVRAAITGPTPTEGDTA